MKTVNSFPKRLAAAFTLILAATSFLTACPGNKGGGDPAPVPVGPVYAACATCSTIGAPTPLISQATSISTIYAFPATISWQVLGDGNLMNQQNSMYGPYYQPSSPYAQYRGPIIVRGGITLNAQVVVGNGAGYYPYQQVPYGSPYGQPYGGGAINPAIANGGQCVIPAGSYTFDTVQAGMMQQGDFRVDDLQAIGPIQFRFRIRAQAARPYGAGVDQVYARLQVTSVNGIPCQGIVVSLQ